MFLDKPVSEESDVAVLYIFWYFMTYQQYTVNVFLIRMILCTTLFPIALLRIVRLIMK